MPYETILVHLDRSPLNARRVEFAARLARAHDAHLVGLAAVSMPVLPGEITQVLGEAYLETRSEQLRGEAQELVAAFEKAAGGEGVISFEGRVAPAPIEEALLLHGRYCDALVLSRPDPEDEGGGLTRDSTAMLTLSLGRPVILVPASWRGEPIGTRIAVSWSATRESVRAVHDAMPLLRAAREVDVLVFNAKSQRGRHGAEPGADIGLYLARHGVKVTTHDEVTQVDVGNSLLSRVSDLGSDMVVMGSFGHSRLRELILGGVSETVLRSSPIPVMMSH